MTKNKLDYLSLVTPTFQIFLIMIRVPPTKSLIIVHLSLFILRSTLPPPHRLHKTKAPTKQVLDLLWWSTIECVWYTQFVIISTPFTDRVIFVSACEVGGKQRTLTRTRGIENNKDLRGHMRSWPPGFAIFQDASLLLWLSSCVGHIAPLCNCTSSHKKNYCVLVRWIIIFCTGSKRL